MAALTAMSRNVNSASKTGSTAVAPAASMALRLLGRFEFVAGDRLRHIGSPRRQALIAYLALRADGRAVL